MCPTFVESRTSGGASAVSKLAASSSRRSSLTALPNPAPCYELDVVQYLEVLHRDEVRFARHADKIHVSSGGKEDAPGGDRRDMRYITDAVFVIERAPPFTAAAMCSFRRTQRAHHLGSFQVSSIFGFF